MMSRLLLIEDDPDIRLLLEEFLLTAGFEVNAAGTVAGGLQFLGSRFYDLIVTDGRLPDGTGVVFMRAGRELGIPVLVITGYASEFPRDELDSCELLKKPFRPSDLIKRIKTLLAAEPAKSQALSPSMRPLSVPVPSQAALGDRAEANSGSCRIALPGADARLRG